MHRAVFLLALAATTDLCDTTPDGTSSGGSGGASVSSACDGKNNCSTCTNCALNGACANLWSTCQNDSDCVAIDTCLPGCNGDTNCQQQCWANSPDGVSDYQAVINCVDCQACAKDCAGMTTCSQ